MRKDNAWLYCLCYLIFYISFNNKLNTLIMTQFKFMSLCGDYLIEPYQVLDDLRDNKKNWQSMTPKQLETFLNERY